MAHSGNPKAKHANRKRLKVFVDMAGSFMAKPGDGRNVALKTLLREKDANGLEILQLNR